MNRLPCIGLMALLLAVVSTATTLRVYGEIFGPLSTQNRYPPHLMFLTPIPDSPRVLKKNSVQTSLTVDYSSLYVNNQSETWDVLMDMEMLTLDFGLKWGVTDALDVSVDVPLIRMDDGFLDGFLENYHNTFGFPNYGKEERPQNEFAYHMRLEDEDWFEADPGSLKLGETVLSAKLKLIGSGNDHAFAASVSYSLKLPTGDQNSGFGSGGIDQGVTLLTRFRFSPVALYFNPGYIFRSDPETLGPEIEVDDSFTLLAGVEFEAGETWSLLAQVNYYSAIFSGTDIPQLDRESTELSFGVVMQISKKMDLELAFCEDLSPAAPDFTVHTQVRYTFGK